MNNENSSDERIQPCCRPHATLKGFLYTCPPSPNCSHPHTLLSGRKQPGHQFSPNKPIISLSPLCLKACLKSIKPASISFLTLFSSVPTAPESAAGLYIPFLAYTHLSLLPPGSFLQPPVLPSMNDATHRLVWYRNQRYPSKFIHVAHPTSSFTWYRYCTITFSPF